MKKLFRHLSYLLHRNQIEADLREEIEAHRQMREDALGRQGDDAPVAGSRRVLGNVVLAREDARHVWIWPSLESVVLDVRHGFRSLLRHRTFTATALITIAVGTGTLTAAFAVAHTVLLKPAPYTNADRIVQILQVRDGRPRSQVSSADIDTLRTATSLEAVSFASNNAVSLTGDGLPENARGISTDRHLFPLLGTQPILGRWPGEADEKAAVPPVVLSHVLWMRRYQGRTDIIGQRLDINGKPHTIVAVMPEPFRFPAPYYVTGDLWFFRDITHPSLKETERPLLLGFGLVSASQSRARAQAEVDTITAGGAARFQLTEWAASMRRNARSTLMLLVAAAGLVFFIVCINLFNLLLCRSLDRSAEMSTRASLGAGNRRLVRQLLTESTVLFAVGGAAGIGLAVWLARGISAIASFDIPRMQETAVDWTVAATGFGLACVAGVLVGWIPARRAARGSQTQANSTRSVTHHRRGRLMQRALITAEISLAVVLVCGAGTLAASAGRFNAADAGFDSAGLVQARASLPIAQYPDVSSQSRVFDDVLIRLRAHPLIAAAGVVDLPPGVAASATPAALVDGDVVPAKVADLRSAAVRVVSDGYLETLGLRPISGRFVRAGEAQLVAVVNATFVKAYLGGREPIGTGVRVTLDGLTDLDPASRMIVGVVPDIKEDVLHKPAPPTVYIPMSQAPSIRMAIVVRPRTESPQLATSIRESLAQAAPGMAVSGLIMPLSTLMEGEYARTRMSLRLVGSLAAVALILAVVGVYGVTAHGVQHRSREIGIRLALGVSPSAIRRMILAEGAVLLGLGLVIGGALAVWLSPVVRSLVVALDQVEVIGPLAGAAVVLTLAVWAGCDIPARRAARVDPASALR